MNISVNNTLYALSSLSNEKSRHYKTGLCDEITLNLATQYPAGASIFCDGKEYISTEPGATVGDRYEQVFYSPFEYKCKAFDFPEWVIDGTPEVFANLLYYALNSAGLRCYIHIGEWPNGVFKDSATVEFNNDSLWSAIGKIQAAFGCEMWLEDDINLHFGYDDSTLNAMCLHFSQYSLGVKGVNLTPGVNIKTPSVSVENPFFNRFYIFGSSRNITQDYQGANVNSLATKRLTLNPVEYPEGYMDYSNGEQVYSKILQFEDVYPSATDLVITNIRSWIKYELDDEGNKIVVGGTEQEPIYSQITIWYVQLKRLVNGSYVDFEYNDSMALPGLVPSLHFNSGPLAGREFEVIYHEDGKYYEADSVGNPAFQVLAGDFEIKYKQETSGGLILPASSGLVPETDNLVVLFNVEMPPAYTEMAYSELKEVALEEIGRNYIKLDSNGIPYESEDGGVLAVDKKEYSAKSDATRFFNGGEGLFRTAIEDIFIIPTE